MHAFEFGEYHSHTELEEKKKFETLDSEDIDLFLDKGLTPVFFGEALVGANIPNITNMVVSDDIEYRASEWKSFVESPEWNVVIYEE